MWLGSLCQIADNLLFDAELRCCVKVEPAPPCACSFTGTHTPVIYFSSGTLYDAQTSAGWADQPAHAHACVRPRRHVHLQGLRQASRHGTLRAGGPAAPLQPLPFRAPQGQRLPPQRCCRWDWGGMHPAALPGATPWSFSAGALCGTNRARLELPFWARHAIVCTFPGLVLLIGEGSVLLIGEAHAQFLLSVASCCTRCCTNGWIGCYRHVHQSSYRFLCPGLW